MTAIGAIFGAYALNSSHSYAEKKEIVLEWQKRLRTWALLGLMLGIFIGL